MATTFLDIGLLQSVQIIFPFILTWVVVYGILEYREIFGNRKGLHSIIAFVFAVFVIISPSITALIRVMAPWFLIILMLFVFVIMLFKVFGLKDDTLIALVSGSGGNEQLVWWIIVISGIIFLASIGSVFFSQPVPNADGTAQAIEGAAADQGQGAFFQTLFHPKIVGMVFVLLIATFTIVLLAGKPK